MLEGKTSKKSGARAALGWPSPRLEDAQSVSSFERMLFLLAWFMVHGLGISGSAVCICVFPSNPHKSVPLNPSRNNYLPV